MSAAADDAPSVKQEADGLAAAPMQAAEPAEPLASKTAAEPPHEAAADVTGPPAEPLASVEPGEEPPAVNGHASEARTAAEAADDSAAAPPEDGARGQEERATSQPYDHAEAWRQYYAKQAQQQSEAGAGETPSGSTPYGGGAGAGPQSPTSSTAPSSLTHAQRRGGHAADLTGGERGVVNPSKIYIGGLPEHTRVEDLEDCFGSIGKVTGIELKNGFGFVEFESDTAAADAVAKYHGGHFLGAEIRVEVSHNGSRAKPYVGGEAGACFKCGRSGHWARDCPMPVAGRPGPGGGPRSRGPPVPPYQVHPSYGGGYGPPGFAGYPGPAPMGPPMGAPSPYGMPPPPGPGYGPPAPMGYDPRSPYGSPPQTDPYYRREAPSPYGMHPGAPPPGASPYPGYGPPDPYAQQPPRNSAWGPPPPTPYGRDPYARGGYDPNNANGRERSPRRRRSLSPSRGGVPLGAPTYGAAYGIPAQGAGVPGYGRR